MSQLANTAVELTLGPDHLELWVDANNNGIRDDDDVNIFVTATGGFYTTSPTFKHALDGALQAQIRDLAMAMLSNPRAREDETQDTLRELALELVVRATTDNGSLAAQQT